MEPDPEITGSESVERKGSVRRAREMLKAGKRPEHVPEPVPTFRTNPAHMTQWPLPNDGFQQIDVANAHARLIVPKGPPPQRPPRPDCPSPSVYSERSVDAVPSPLNVKRPIPSFSQPLPIQPALRPAIRVPIPPSPSSVAGSTTRASIATEDLFRQSGVSSVGTISLTDLPGTAHPLSTEHGAASGLPLRKAGGLAPPMPALRPDDHRGSSVSPIPEELPDSPTISKELHAPSRPYPPSWCSGPAESEILGTYLDGDSDDSGSQHSVQVAAPALLRQASIGTRGKPALRTIQKSSTNSPVPQMDKTPVSARPTTADTATTEAVLKEIAIGRERNDSLSTVSSGSTHCGTEKAPIMLDLSAEHPTLARSLDQNAALKKEAGGLPKAAPAMSEKRPMARRPPRLDMNAVRDAEARGSLTSLPDLIRRATKLASNLEHGRTASRNDLLNGGNSRFHQRRNSGSIQSILASFPPPAAVQDGAHSSWPFFFRRSTLHQIHTNEPPQAADQEKAQPKQARRCCGMPPWLFGLVCVLIIIIILAAILIPVCLVVLKHKSSGSDCAKSTPCENGGVSVSSGDVCSCVCANGYTGTRCATAGDASCVTATINDKSATMGSDLPDLFEGAQQNYSISLDETTIMALFSQNNVSCTTENSLVSFSGISTSSSKSRRAFLPWYDLTESSNSNPLPFTYEQSPPISATPNLPTQVLVARASIATENGIIYDDTPPTKTGEAGTATATATTTHAATATTDVRHPGSQTTSTVTAASSSPTSTADASSSSKTTTVVSSKALNFARISVLYIFQETGTLSAATFAGNDLQLYLTNVYTEESKHIHAVDLSPSGVKGNFTLNFDQYEITLPNGNVVGG
ncbi:uncharacterized protein BP01DRAFT_366147 [Aspergillus saccharolyticus JOP 1030-1]|uniref:EGF-like domain-containing protein n=1 Tax=Aspergillus saccharolyticus JOP 1030-1 TaxID=1450539 RepID=A0A318ZBZ0_9EURO|nr:hypothetical protein BP01DRAFT_366147 [Aspergillus saccharolyticus JOP 1030-1]PYH44935.1 hypothetical protein BP01DRAFT_366147 [Aspergillus saccharolyticus JOP 1030-1]